MVGKGLTQFRSGKSNRKNQIENECGEIGEDDTQECPVKAMMILYDQKRQKREYITQ
jgi:hypothetical protein